jgi:hypothetical protein
MVASPIAKQQPIKEFPSKETPTQQPLTSPKPQPTPPPKPLPTPNRESSTKELPSTADKPATANNSGWSRTDSTKRERTNEGVENTNTKNNKNSAERNKGSRERNFFGARDKKVFSDVEGDTFSLFRRMNEIREEKKQAADADKKKDSEPKEEEPREAPVIDGDLTSDGTEALIREFSVKEDMNKEGMKKAKKFTVAAGKGQPKFQMEVCLYERVLVLVLVFVLVLVLVLVFAFYFGFEFGLGLDMIWFRFRFRLWFPFRFRFCFSCGEGFFFFFFLLLYSWSHLLTQGHEFLLLSA